MGLTEAHGMRDLRGRAKAGTMSARKDRLMARVCTKISDGRALDLIEGYLHQGVMEELSHWEPVTGTPQGAVISPLLSNIFLNPFDWTMLRGLVRTMPHHPELSRLPDE